MAALAWTASGPTNTLPGHDVTNHYLEVKKDYDLIFWDSTRFQERTNNNWRLVATAKTNWMVDDGGQQRPRGTIRFYRASYKDRWRTTRLDGTNVVPQRPLASEEVYALHNIILSGGQNFVGLHGKPYTNNFLGVFGSLETFPGGTTANPASGSTVVEFFGPGTNAPTTEQYYLNSEGRWISVNGNGADVTTNSMADGFFSRGFSINLPRPLPESYVTATASDYSQVDAMGNPAQVPAMVWSPIVQVPTNGFSQMIYTGSRATRPNTLVYNVAALRLPVSAHPSEMRLLESGFVNGPVGQSDEIYTMNTATKDVLGGSTIYCDQNGVWRFVANTNVVVPAGYFKPNDVLVIVSRNWVGNGYWTWSYHPAQFYSLPTRWMGY